MGFWNIKTHLQWNTSKKKNTLRIQIYEPVEGGILIQNTTTVTSKGVPGESFASCLLALVPQFPLLLLLLLHFFPERKIQFLLAADMKTRNPSCLGTRLEWWNCPSSWIEQAPASSVWRELLLDHPSILWANLIHPFNTESFCGVCSSRELWIM